MSERMLVATRKGLLQVARKNGGWSIARTDFPGVPVTSVLRDPRDGALYAALKHGHFGAKLHRSDDQGGNWKELAAPAFAADTPGAPNLLQVWTMEAGGKDRPGRPWAGAIPAGMFRSNDRGESWQLVSALWNVPERPKWFGGGYDDAGIHTISPDPRNAGRVFVAISCGGVWDLPDAGKGWALTRRRAWSRPTCRPNSGRRDCETAGPAPGGALRGSARRDVDAAPLRHLPLDRRRCQAVAAAQIAGARTPASRWSRTRSDPLTAWFVPAIKDEAARAARRRARRDAHAGRLVHDLASRSMQRPAAARRVSTWSTATASTWTRAGTQLAMGSTTGSTVGERECGRGLAAW